MFYHVNSKNIKDMLNKKDSSGASDKYKSKEFIDSDDDSSDEEKEKKKKAAAKKPEPTKEKPKSESESGGDDSGDDAAEQVCVEIFLSNDYIIYILILFNLGFLGAAQD